MSDLAATNCGCDCQDGGNNWLFIILVLLLFGNNGCGCNNGCGNDNSNIIWLLIILSACGGGCGNILGNFGGCGGCGGCGC